MPQRALSTRGIGKGKETVASVATLAVTAVRAGKVGVDEVAAEGDRRDGRAAEEDGGLSGERGEGEHLGRELERWRREMRELTSGQGIQAFYSLETDLLIITDNQKRALDKQTNNIQALAINNQIPF